MIEIGSGSGVVTTFLRQILSLNLSDKKDTASFFSFCTDLNIKALNCSKDTAKMNKIDLTKIEFINCDLLNPLLQRLQNQVDILIFNPPYVPSEKSAQNITVIFLNFIFFIFLGLVLCGWSKWPGNY